jgi:hypothetical protein
MRSGGQLIHMALAFSCAAGCAQVQPLLIGTYTNTDAHSRGIYSALFDAKTGAREPRGGGGNGEPVFSCATSFAAASIRRQRSAGWDGKQFRDRPKRRIDAYWHLIYRRRSPVPSGRRSEREMAAHGQLQRRQHFRHADFGGRERREGDSDPAYRFGA